MTFYISPGKRVISSHWIRQWIIITNMEDCAWLEMIGNTQSYSELSTQYESHTSLLLENSQCLHTIVVILWRLLMAKKWSYIQVFDNCPGTRPQNQHYLLKSGYFQPAQMILHHLSFPFFLLDSLSRHCTWACGLRKQPTLLV